MNNTNDLRFECVHCGKCCTDLDTLVNTTYSDIIRIKNSLNLNLDEIIEILGFYIFDKNLPQWKLVGWLFHLSKRKEV